jgi:hypothetical protein
MEASVRLYSRLSAHYHNLATAQLDGSVTVLAAATTFSAAADIMMFLKSHIKTSPSPNTTNDPPSVNYCTICLTKLEKKAFYPDQCCCQQYCFPCLLQRSQFNPECPWCKEKFTLIVHPVSKVDHSRLVTRTKWRQMKEEVETVCRKVTDGLGSM